MLREFNFTARSHEGWRNALLVTAFGAMMLLPAIIKGVPRGNDLPHHYRTALSFYNSIGNGNLYPGWNAEATSGYGDVTFRFYPPAIYYAMAFSRALTGNWYDSSLLLFAFLSAAGGLGVYLWARAHLDGNLAMWAGIFYTFVPFHINELYQAFLLPEYAASALLPFSFAFTELVCERQRPKDVFGLAASYALLILTHLPLAIIGSLALLIYTLLLIKKRTWMKTVMRLGLGVTVGLAASARYWVTMIAELPWLKAAPSAPSSWFDYRLNFLFWKSVEGSTSWWANVLAIATALMFLPAVALLLRNKTGSSARRLRAVAILMLFSFFMATPLSLPVWSVLPFLQRVEFPWRWLAITSVCGPVLLASSIPHWVEKARNNRRPAVIAAVGCVLISAALTFLQIVRGATYLPRSTFDSLVKQVGSSNSLNFWLPQWASVDARVMKSEIEIGDRPFAINLWGPERREFQVGPGFPSEARVRTFYYPCWVARVGSARMPTRADTDGALLISLPGDAVSVNLEFSEPPRTSMAMAASIIGWALIGAGLCICSYKEKLESESRIEMI